MKCGDLRQSSACAECDVPSDEAVRQRMAAIFQEGQVGVLKKLVGSRHERWLERQGVGAAV